LAQNEIKLNVSDGNLTVTAPKGKFTQQLQKKVKQHKNELMASLNEAINNKQMKSISRIVPDSDYQSPFPLSDLQLGFFMANEPSMEFHVRPHFYMENNLKHLNVLKYEQSWNKALKRHSHSLYFVNNDLKLELLAHTPTIKCVINDYRNLTTEQAEDELLSYRLRHEREELPIDHWPWLKLSVSMWFDQDRQEHFRIHYNHNNFFIDGFATTQLIQEVNAYYEDSNLYLPPLNLNFKDAALALTKLADSEIGQQAKKYWFDRLDSLPPPPALPQITEKNRHCRSMLERFDRVFDEKIWSAFKKNAEHYGITHSSAFINAYTHVLCLWSGGDHFILSQMVTRRFAELHPEIKSVLGNFASLYPLEIKVKLEKTFVENAIALQRQILQDIKHIQFGGMQILQELNRRKGAFGTAPSPYVVGSALFAKGYKKPDYSILETSQTQLDNQFFELENGGCYCVWDVFLEFFPAGLIEDMWEAFQNLVVQLANSKKAWDMNDFNLLPQSMLKVRSQKNETARCIPSVLLHKLASCDKNSNPKQLAVIDEKGTLSYGDYAKRSDALSSCLMACNESIKGKTVAIIMDRNQGCVTAVMSVLKAGAAYVPIDPKIPKGRIHMLLAETTSGLVITEEKYFGLIDPSENIKIIDVFKFEQRKGWTENAKPSAVKFTDLAYVIYTSGSTGRPKGVMIDHRGAVNTVLDINHRFNVSAADVFMSISAFNFDLSVYDIFGAYATKACVVFPDHNRILDPAHWAELINTHQATIWNTVPALMQLLIDFAERSNIRFDSIRLVLLSGDLIPVDLPDAIKKSCPNALVISLGGATEASIWSIIYPIEESTLNLKSIPYGSPMVNQRWHIKDKIGRDCPDWVPGQLYIAGQGLAQGYWQDPQKTTEQFIDDANTNERLYRTGDLGRYFPDGTIQFIGRVDYQVKIQGNRVELGEIESNLLSFPGVKQAVVTLSEGSNKNLQNLVAHVVPEEPSKKSKTQIDKEQIERHLSKKLPTYMVPKLWHIMDVLPVTTNGKVDRKKLTTLYTNQVDSKQTVIEYAAPQSNTQKALHVIWCDILNFEKIGINDNFFDLGGQSFDGIRIITIINKQFNKNLSLIDLLNSRDIASLALKIADKERPEEYRYVKAIKSTGDGPTLFLIHPAGGSISGYYELANHLDNVVFGLEVTDFDQDEHIFKSIKTMACAYANEITQIQKTGPIIIGGWSTGGMIAHAVVKELERKGYQFVTTLILDGPTPMKFAILADLQVAKWFLEDLNLGININAQTEKIDAAPDLLKQYIKAAKSDDIRLPGFPELWAIFRIFNAMVRAGSDHQPEIIDSDVNVVRVSNEVVSEFIDHPQIDSKDWGWGLFSNGNVKHIKVKGNHHDFLKDGHVKKLADQLKAYLNGVNE